MRAGATLLQNQVSRVSEMVGSGEQGLTVCAQSDPMAKKEEGHAEFAHLQTYRPLQG